MKFLPPILLLLLVGSLPGFSQTNEEETFKLVEEMPVYPGGEKAMIKYLQKNIHYPRKARKKGITGIVYVSFVLEKDGKVTEVKVVKGVDPLLDNEAIRVIALMPNWTPGKQNGKTVRVQFNIPIKFSLK